jgi:hypothetical protein
MTGELSPDLGPPFSTWGFTETDQRGKVDTMRRGTSYIMRRGLAVRPCEQLQPGLGVTAQHALILMHLLDEVVDFIRLGAVHAQPGGPEGVRFGTSDDRWLPPFEQQQLLSAAHSVPTCDFSRNLQASGIVDLGPVERSAVVGKPPSSCYSVCAKQVLLGRPQEQVRIISGHFPHWKPAQRVNA